MVPVWIQSLVFNRRATVDCMIDTLWDSHFNVWVSKEGFIFGDEVTAGKDGEVDGE